MLHSDILRRFLEYTSKEDSPPRRFQSMVNRECVVSQMYQSRTDIRCLRERITINRCIPLRISQNQTGLCYRPTYLRQTYPQKRFGSHSFLHFVISVCQA